MQMQCWKYHGLGNDYLIVDAPEGLSSDQIAAICQRHFGVGADGVLLRELSVVGTDFAVRIFNPNGGEAEKSGNGLRIFARYLFDVGLVGTQPFTIATLGGVVTAQVAADGARVVVEMGRAVSEGRDVVIVAGDRTFTTQLVNMGNPHCVIFLPQISAELAYHYGPLLETDPYFPNCTNVQFAQVVDHNTLRIEIWERGAGYTLASGSSSCAAAAAAHWLGLCSADVTVHMPGGTLAVAIADDDMVTLTGPVVKVMDGVISAEILPPNHAPRKL